MKQRPAPGLRVAQLWEAPVERNRYERRWLEAAHAIGARRRAPRVLAGDDEAGVFAMEYLPRPAGLEGGTARRTRADPCVRRATSGIKTRRHP